MSGETKARNDKHCQFEVLLALSYQISGVSSTTTSRWPTVSGVVPFCIPIAFLVRFGPILYTDGIPRAVWAILYTDSFPRAVVV